MRISAFALVFAAAFSAGAAFAVNPPASSPSGLVLHATLGEFTGRNLELAEPVGEILPGQTFSITGDCVDEVTSANELRVVLTLAGTPGAIPGYRSVVATDRAMQGDALQVRVPNLPETANLVFHVNIFMLRESAPEMCKAGAIRIGGGAAGKVG